MEEEFEEFVDLDYEFDAPRFCDFTQPETYWEAVEAEQWFKLAGSYPPSPFLLKLSGENAVPTENVNSSGDSGNGKSLNIVDDNNSGPRVDSEEDSAIEDNGRGLERCNQTIQSKTRSLSKSTRSRSKGSTLMKPTASHLAKQKNPAEVQTPRFFRRFQKQNSSSIDGQLTKRQKLEAGYLRMAAHLKHQTLFTHKKPMEADLTDVNLASRPKVTVPRQPNLETAHRAQRHKCRTNAESGGHTKSSSHMFKARPLNKKIFEAPSLPFHKKRTPQLPEFHVFHFKTSERAVQHTSSNAGGTLNCNSTSNSETRDLKRTNSADGSKQDKCGMINKLRGSPDDKHLPCKGERGVFRNIEPENLFPLEPNDERFLNEPPTQLFSKLSLASEEKHNTKSQLKEQPISKGLKENRPGSFHQEHEKLNLVKEEIQRHCGKHYQLVNDMGFLISNHTCMLETGH